MTCTPSEDSDQPGHPPSLIRSFAVRMKKVRVLGYPLSAQRRLWSDLADAKPDRNLRWAQRSFCEFCRAMAHIYYWLRIAGGPWECRIYNYCSWTNKLNKTEPNVSYRVWFPCFQGISFSERIPSCTVGIPCVKFWSILWAAPSEFGTYRLCEQRRFRRACASAQSRQNLRCSLIQALSQEEPSDRKPDPWPFWMVGHAQLKFVMTECSKTQIRLTGLLLKQQ